MQNRNKVNFPKVLIATAGALLANSIVFAIGTSAGASWDVGQPFLVGIAIVLGATALPMLLGALVAGFVSGKWSKAQNWFAWGVLAFSVVGSPSGWAASGQAATGLALAAMHVVVGLAWFWAIKPSAIVAAKVA